MVLGKPMRRTIAIFVFAMLLGQLGSSALAQESDNSDPFLQPRVARLESSTSFRDSDPVLVDLDVDSSPSTTLENNAPIKFKDQTIPDNLDERHAEIQGKVFADGLRLLGYATLLICAAIVGLVFYGKQKSKRRRELWY